MSSKKINLKWKKHIGETTYLNIVLLINLIVSGIFFYRYCNNDSDIFTFLYICFISALVVFFFTLIRAHYKADVRDHVLSCIFVFFMGPFGCLISIVSNTFHTIFSRKLTTNFSDWLFNYLFEMDAQEKESDKIYNRIISGQEEYAERVDTDPLVDVMDFGTVDQKQAALIKVVKNFSPHLAPVIQMGLNDENNAIRVQSAAGLAKLQDEFNKKYTYYEKKVHDGTDDPEELMNFAKVCEDYSNSRLLDSERTSAAIEKSILLYERAIELAPENIELKVSLIRVLMVHSEFDRAYKVYEQIIDKLEAPSEVIVMTLMELLLRLKRFGEIKKLAARLKDMEQESGIKYSDILDIWTGGGSEQELRWEKNNGKS